MADATKTILLVEDSDDDVVFFQRTFKFCKFTNPVTVVPTGEEATACLQGQGKFRDRKVFPFPAVVILDLSLPGIHGLEVLKFIRAQTDFPKLMVIVLTGAAQLDVVRESYRLGADSFLTKPCKPEDICNLAVGFPDYWSPIPEE